MSGQQHAERLLPLLEEYAEKMQHLLERSADILEEIWAQGSVERLSFEVARLICLFDTLTKPVTDLCRTGSGLLEHADLEPFLWAELKLRLDETEEHIRFSTVTVEELKAVIVDDKRRLERMRAVVEKSGRYKAPF